MESKMEIDASSCSLYFHAQVSEHARRCRFRINSETINVTSIAIRKHFLPGAKITASGGCTAKGDAMIEFGRCFTQIVTRTTKERVVVLINKISSVYVLSF